MLDLRTVMNSPIYWTAAVYHYTSSTGWHFKGWMPTVKTTQMSFMNREMDLKAGAPPGVQIKTIPYYWDGKSWNYANKTTGISGDESLPVVIGVLERRSPLPPGRYWQDIFLKQGPAFRDWLEEHLKSGAVVLEKTEFFKADPLRDGSWLPAVLQPDSPGTIAERTWVLFRVVRPVDWPATKLGFPTIADDSVQTSADTATIPPGPSPTDEIAEGLSKIVTPVTTILALFLGIKVVQSLRK